MNSQTLPTQPADSPKNGEATIADSVHEAQLLLTYVARNGIEIDSNVVAELVQAKYGLEQAQWTAEQEIKFWSAFNALTKVVQPVSVASLKATQAVPMGAKISPARQAVGVYQRWSVFLLILLLIAHVYWSMGAVRFTTAADYPKQIQQLQERLEIERSRTPQEKWAESREINTLEVERERYDLLVQASLIRLMAWNPTRIFDLDNIAVPEETVGEKPELGPFQLDIVTKDVQFTLELMQFYILPLLYGLLGASAYVLRNLNTAIRDITYVTESNISYRLRIQLGGLSGLAIGWFPTTDSLVSFGSLTPMALAFAMGYNVEILFASMDKFILRFSTLGTPPPQKKPTPPTDS